MKAWLWFFRIVNLPTVPGDVFVGAAAAGAVGASPLPVAAAALASCALYLFGLADNDIVGAATDGPDRPIPAGAISLRAARIARGLCLFAALVCGAAANLPWRWWAAAALLAVVVIVYNRTKWSVAMGLGRGLNVLCGGMAVLADRSSAAPGPLGAWALGIAVAVWTAYIAAVTRYSEGESLDPAKRRRVGLLVGALVYLQVAALLYVHLLAPSVASRNLLLAGAVALVCLRAAKRLFPRVSAS